MTTMTPEQQFFCLIKDQYNKTTMEIHHPLAGQLLCPTCNIHFPSAVNHKEHYKSDHHRYNIKRKMVKLPPVTVEQFSAKMQEVKIHDEHQFLCKECRKVFGSANTLNQHVKSKGHNPNAIVEPKPKVVKEALVFVKNECKCLFCCQTQDSLEDNATHMYSEHGFFISEKNFCKDMKGLIEYLQQKIQVGNLCITCDNKGTKDFQTADSVRQHMIDRGHTFMNTTKGFEEYEKFYDFSILFEEKLKEQKNIIPGIEFEKVKVLIDENESQTKMELQDDNDDWEDEQSDEEDVQENDQDWEDEQEGDESEQEKEEKIKPIKESIKQEKQKYRTKTYQIMKPTMTANDELLLPNGKILGHRKYRHIYKQNVRLPNWFGQQLKMISNGEGSSSIATVAERRGLLEAVKIERINLKHAIRDKRVFLHVGMANNLQKNYRCQNSL